jgi:hypothetical protein
MSQMHFNHIEIMLIIRNMKVKLLKVIQVHFYEGGLTLNACCETK